jgi:hypothetical protein
MEAVCTSETSVALPDLHGTKSHGQNRFNQLSYPVVGGISLFRNICSSLPNYTTSHHNTVIVIIAMVRISHLAHLNPVQNSTFYVFQIHFNIILASMPRLLTFCFPSRFSDYSFLYIFLARLFMLHVLPITVKLKGKLPLFLMKHCSMKTWGSGGVAPSFFTSALEGGKCSASRPGPFTPVEIARGSHWIREILDGPQSRCGRCEEEKVLPLTGLVRRPSSPQSVTIPNELSRLLPHPL